MNLVILMADSRIKESTIRRSNRTRKPKIYSDEDVKEEKSDRNVRRKVGTRTPVTEKVKKIVVNSQTNVEHPTETAKPASAERKKVVVDFKANVRHPTTPPAVVGQVCHKKFLRKKKMKKKFRFVIDWSEIESGIDQCITTVNLNDFKTYLQGKGVANVEVQKVKILINSDVAIEKKKLKLLIKTYLKKKKLHNYIQVNSGGQHSFTYKLKYFRSL